MPFLQSSQSLRSKSYLSEVSVPVIVGLLALVFACVVLFGGNVLSAASGATFEINSSVAENEGQTASISPDSELSTQRSLAAASADFDSSTPEVSTPPATIYVFVSGCVQNPGVFSLKEGARVDDAIKAAGGFSEDAATDYNNLARVAVDGEQIHVPSVEDVASGSTGGVLLQEGAELYAGTSSTQGMQEAGSAGALVNINSASAAELETLPGIGPSTAQKIIANREANGPFSTIEDLMRVSGIGEKKYEALKGLICI